MGFDTPYWIEDPDFDLKTPTQVRFLWKSAQYDTDALGNPIFIRLGNRGRTYAKRTGPGRNADGRPQEAPVGTLNTRSRRPLTVTPVAFQSLFSMYPSTVTSPRLMVAT